MPSDYEYEARAAREARAKITEVQKAPLRDRKEAQLEFFEAMRDEPKLVAERVGWLLAGNYGYGEKQMALRVLESPRMNRVAALTQMAGVFEWQCPEDMTRAAWKKLSPGEKEDLLKAVQKAIEHAEHAED